MERCWGKSEDDRWNEFFHESQGLRPCFFGMYWHLWYLHALSLSLNQVILLEVKHVSTGTEDNVISCPISLIQVKWLQGTTTTTTTTTAAATTTTTTTTATTTGNVCTNSVKTLWWWLHKSFSNRVGYVSPFPFFAFFSRNKTIKHLGKVFQK